MKYTLLALLLSGALAYNENPYNGYGQGGCYYGWNSAYCRGNDDVAYAFVAFFFLFLLFGVVLCSVAPWPYDGTYVAVPLPQQQTQSTNVHVHHHRRPQ